MALLRGDGVDRPSPYGSVTGAGVSGAGFMCVEALGRIIIRGPYPPSNAIIYMHLQL